MDIKKIFDVVNVETFCRCAGESEIKQRRQRLTMVGRLGTHKVVCTDVFIYIYALGLCEYMRYNIHYTRCIVAVDDFFLFFKKNIIIR